MTTNGPLLLGIDIGTSGTKALLVGLDGRTHAAAHREYAPDTPGGGAAEQDPDVWLAAAIATAREAVEQAGRPDVAAIGFSGQMHSAVFLGAAGEVVRPAILWLDTRSGPQARAVEERFGAAQLAAWTGNPVMAGVTLGSALWLREHEPHNWHRVAHLVLSKDYVRYRLTGQLHTDYSDASATALFDPQARRWAEGLLAATGLPRAWLPEPVASSQVAGRLQSDVAAAMSLPAGIPVVCGAGDQEAQAVGNGIIRPGLLSSTIGTGGQLFAPIETYRCDPALRLHTFCHAVPGLWHWMAATLTAGMSLRWLRDAVLAGRYSYDELAAAASEIEPGAEGLMFLPYLAGERTPHLDPLARGVFYGLTLRHTWRHMARAVMEGVVFSLLDGLNLMRQMGGKVERAVASGGGARHPLWLQLQADIFGMDIVRTESGEAAALGAALLGGTGAGLYPDLPTACRQAVRWSDAVVQPQPERAARYRALAERYRALYPALATTFHDHPGEAQT